MNNAPKVEAYKSFYEQGKQLYAQGDMEGAKSAFLKACELANKISVESTTYDTRMEYHKIAEKLLKFARENCNNVPKQPVKQNEQKKDDETPVFKPVEASKEDRITFADVAGLQDVKDQIIFNVIEPMKNPELAKKYKVKAGGKVILYGPPGTGKTFIARAIAGEVDAVFYAINCQDLISKYMGESSKQLDALFDQAQQNERAIIFFDEFDSVASKREDSTGGVDAEMARFVATFLTKVDGFKKSKTCKMLLLIAATNRPWALDTAMTRGGRFDTQIYVGMPDLPAREFMVNKAMKGLPLAPDVNLKSIAEQLDGFCGGDINSICDKIKVEAYKRSVRSGAESVITVEDCNKFIKGARRNISKAELARFDEYRDSNSNM